MAQYRVHVKISPWKEGGYVAEVPGLQGCWLVADTIAEALEGIYEGADMIICSRLKHGVPLPPEVVSINDSKTIEFDLPVRLAPE